MPRPEIQIRPARRADRWAIRYVVWTARINPTGLHWPRFLVAEETGQGKPSGASGSSRAGGKAGGPSWPFPIVGVGQIKTHRDGSRELASLAVMPKWRGRGLGSSIVRALQERAGPPLYLICRPRLEPFYGRLGFCRVVPAEMPPSFRRLHRLGQAIRRLLPRRWGEQMGIVVLKWNPHTSAIARTAQATSRARNSSQVSTIAT